VSDTPHILVICTEQKEFRENVPSEVYDEIITSPRVTVELRGRNAGQYLVKKHLPVQFAGRTFLFIDAEKTR
jgi:hypothetical protein